ncbi:MAG: UvrB/UvrC motif-containing protein, partial [Verrucomicrobiales bacterium]|nr:UvrB/UvrC motif-containing protein [Verrucomicrobiales bacterium]
GEEMRKIDLCEKCAKEMGVSQAAGFSLTELLMQERDSDADDPARQCPVCGLDERDFCKTGLLGCPHCYEAFAPAISEILHDTQRASRHVGKIPRRQVVCRQALEQDLADAVREENYELAARLRNQLKNLFG